MKFVFTVEVEVERTQGKFAAKDEIGAVIQEMIEGANEGMVDGVGADGESEYEIIDWSVSS